VNLSRLGWVLVAAGLLLVAAGHLTPAPAPLARQGRPSEPPWPLGEWSTLDEGVRVGFFADGTYAESTPSRTLGGTWSYDPWTKDKVTASVLLPGGENVTWHGYYRRAGGGMRCSNWGLIGPFRRSGSCKQTTDRR
jgi:hypothetical protein